MFHVPTGPAPEPTPGFDVAAVSDHVRLEADLVKAGAADEGAETARGRRRVVLVVGDDPDTRRYLKRCLTGPETGAPVVLEVADGLAALERARQGGLDLLVIDAGAPHSDGRALCRALRADAALRRIPVLLITGEHAPAALPDGVGGVLAKPFNAARMRERVARLLGLPP